MIVYGRKDEFGKKYELQEQKISQNKTLGTKITIDSSLNCTLQLKPIYNRNNKIIN